MLDKAALEKRRDELQGLYNQTHAKARELAGAIAMLEELIEGLTAPEDLEGT